jgi:hypothetical protein
MGNSGGHARASKKRNRRVFPNVAFPVQVVARLVRDEIEQRAYAYTEDPEHFLPLAGFLPVSASFLLSDLL